MNGEERIKIKICGLSRPCDIAYVNEARPDYIGFILCYPKSRRNITVEQAARLRSMLAPGIRAAGVFVDQPVETVTRAAGQIGLDVIQLHGSEDEAYIAALKGQAAIPVWKAFRVKGVSDAAAAEACGADEILLDAGAGDGKAFDWELAGALQRPFILAGGLTPGTIPEAIRRLHPRMVDLSSGVETDGVKDEAKIRAAVEAVRRS